MNSIGKLLTGASLACVALGSVSSASAATITALTGFTTLGSNMDGMEITVNFQNGTSSTDIWKDLNSTTGGAGTGGWSLTQSGNTFGGQWEFKNNTGASITSLVINAITGKTVFDISPSLDPMYSTNGSADGIKYYTASGTAPTSFVYDNIVNLDGQAAVGDLYSQLTLLWSNGLSSGQSLKFVADTDNATFVVSTANPNKPVPVPGVVAGVVFAAGFFGSKEINKRKANQKIKA